MEKEVIVWFDKEADYLEVIFKKEAGYFKETENEAVMEKVNLKGETIGFSILKVSEKGLSPISIVLRSESSENSIKLR